MVKPDAKCDYYADLELPSTADAEDIKRQFRQLAKKFHPDRNPGREEEVLAKFQAVQAAHEILSDTQTKTKYDQDRAKFNRVNTTFNTPESDPYNFRKPTTKPPPSASHFPPPPRRTQTTKDFNTGTSARFATTTGRTGPGPTAPGVEKFKAFTRAAPQWDRAKFDEAARADAARGFQSMKGMKQFPGPPPQPARQTRAPTAPRPTAFDSTSPNDDQQSHGPGFPGMSRTANMRRSGFDPSSPNPGMGEQQAPNGASAYASYNRGERPQASHGYFSEGLAPHSPPVAHQKPVSPLRHVRSESGWDVPKPQRPDLERVSSKYPNTPGERTSPGGGLGRSASVRTSPVERRWDEHDGRAYMDRPHSHHGPSRNRSSSPRMRPSGVPVVDYSSSSSESSGEDRPTFASRKKAQPRRPKVQTADGEQHGHRPFSDDDPALTGQFPSYNYTKIVDDNKYKYPVPNDSPVRRPFQNMPSPAHAHPSTNGNNRHPDDGVSKYGPFSSFSQHMSSSARARRNTQTSTSLYGPPSWQVPSSVMPSLASPLTRYRMASIPEGKRPALRGRPPNTPIPSDFEFDHELLKADSLSRNSQPRLPTEHMHPTHTAPNLESVSEENVKSKFAAADWEGKFGSGDEFLRPSTDTSDRDRRSPNRTTRPRARSTGKVKLNAQDHVRENIPPVQGINGDRHAEAANGANEAQSGSERNFYFVDVQEQSKASAFQPGRFSADKWAEKFKEQTWTTPSNELSPRRPNPQKKLSKSLPRKQSTRDTPAGEPFLPQTDPVTNTTEDAMDIDGDSMENVTTFGMKAEPHIKIGPAAPGGNGDLNVSLGDLKQTAPFGPSATGLKDLDDLSNTLPFESRAAPSVDPALNRTISSTARRLNLPKPPKTLIAPLEDNLTQKVWEDYVRNIETYLHDWNVFNLKMLDHFRTRQDQINVGMRHNWISSVGDGPSVENFDTAGDSSLRAGFATYMAWLEDDARCRSWWDAANERHRECFENFARVRERAKKAKGLL